MRSAFARGQGAAAITLWQGCVSLFSDHATDRQGAVGSYEGLTQVLLELAAEAVERAEAGQLYEVAPNIVRALGPLAAIRSSSHEYAMFLATTSDMLGRLAEKRWGDDKTFVPNAAVETVGEMTRLSLEHDALEEGLRGLGVLADLGVKAVVARKQHIALPAIRGFVQVLPVITQIEDMSSRRAALKQWAKLATSLAPLRAVENTYLSVTRPVDFLIPGISISGGGLNSLLWQIRGDQSAIEDLVFGMLRWLSSALAILCRTDSAETVSTLNDGLTVVYNVALLAAGRLPTNAGLAARIGRVLLSWTKETHPRGPTGQVLLDDDVAEVVWSTMMACGYLAKSTAVVSDTAAWFLGVLAFEESAKTIHDEYVRSFVQGLLIAAGSKPEYITNVIASITPQEWWRGGSGMHIPGFDNAPALNRNRSAAPPLLIDRINQWAVEQWPAFQRKPQPHANSSG